MTLTAQAMRALRSPLAIVAIVAALLACITMAARAQTWGWSVALWIVSATLTLALVAVLLGDPDA